MSELVMDSSGLFARFNKEPGAAKVIEHMARADTVRMSSVNVAEVASKLAESGLGQHEIRSVLSTLNLTWEPFTFEDAVAAGMLRPFTRSAGLSLGDRACLALGLKLGVPVLTADRAWATLDLPIEVILAR